MATTSFSFGAGQSNYTGEVLNDLLSYTAQENETYKNGLIHVESGIQKKLALPLIQRSAFIQSRTPTPRQASQNNLSADSVGGFTFTERYLEPQDFMIYLEFNPRDFESYYKQFQPKGNLVFRELDPRVQATMLRLLMEGKESYINNAIWRSAKATDAAHVKDNASPAAAQTIIGGDDAAGPMSFFGGALYRIIANANATAGSEEANGGKVTITGNASFTGNVATAGAAIETEMYNMWQHLPKELRSDPKLEFLMDYNTWDIYDQYLSSKDVKYTDNREENQRRFRGRRVIPMVALPDNTIILGRFTTGRDSNLWMGVDYADAENTIQVDRLQNNSELYFFKALLKMDVNIVRPKEIVAHLPFTWSA